MEAIKIDYIDFYDVCFNYNIARSKEDKMIFFNILKYYLDNLDGKKYLIKVLNGQPTVMNRIITSSVKCDKLSILLSYFNDSEIDILLNEIKVLTEYKIDTIHSNATKQKYAQEHELLSRQIIRFRTIRKYRIVVDELLRKYKNEKYLNNIILSYL